jgi:hypothetical protein
MDFSLLLKTSVLPNPNCPQAILLTDQCTVIGRYGTAKLDTSRTHEVSKRHAKITFKEVGGRRRWNLDDMGSLNGTFLNATKVRSSILESQDELVFGGGSSFMYGDTIVSTDNAECRYLFVVPDPPLEIPAESHLFDTLAPPHLCEDCCLCYDPMLMRTVLQCGHVFCRDCLAAWGRKCILDEMEFVCPVCRRPHDCSERKVPQVTFEGEVWVLRNVEPLLRKLEMLSLSELTDLSLLKRWDCNQRRSFWSCYEKLAGKEKKLMIFRDLTHSSFRAIKDTDEDGLLNAMENLDGDTSLTGEVLRENVLWIVGNRLYHLSRNPVVVPDA